MPKRNFLGIPDDQRGMLVRDLVAVISFFVTLEGTLLSIAIILNNLRGALICAVAGFIVFIITFGLLAFFISELNRKELIYNVVSSSPLVMINKENMTLTTRERFELPQYQGTDILGMRLVVLKIRNAGNTNILDTEYDNKPIIISFGAKILDDVKIGDKSRNDLSPHITKDEEKVFIHPFTLGRGDWFTFRVLLDNIVEKDIVFEPNPNFAFRIQKSEALQDREKTILTRVSIAKNAALLVLCVCSAALFWGIINGYTASYLLVLLAAITLAYLYFAIDSISNIFINLLLNRGS